MVTQHLEGWEGLFVETDVTTIHCTPETRAAFPDPLASVWRQAYPCLFDDDDVRITVEQPAYHFGEWLGAIYLHHAYGVSALVEKYRAKPASHPRKADLFEQIVGPNAVKLFRSLKGAPPDLFLFTPDHSQWWFAEIKRPREGPTECQPANFRKIKEETGASIRLLVIEG